jgi:hypothetical protein
MKETSKKFATLIISNLPENCGKPELKDILR